MRVWRLIETGFLSPYQNMAYDEALFVNHQVQEKPILRIYGWNPSAFSLGFSQDALSVLDIYKCRREGIPFVRRITGGSIIFHEKELTYSIVCSQSDLGGNLTVKESFKVICSFILNFYRKLGLKPYFCIDKPPFLKKKSSSFCFSSLEDYDIVIENKKIGGNAQKRKKGIVLQQGVIPLSLNFKKIKRFLNDDLSSLEEKAASLGGLLGRELDFEKSSLLIKESFQDSFSCKLEQSCFFYREEKLAKILEKEKYSTAAWNIYRVFNSS